MPATIEEQIGLRIAALPAERQRQVLDFARSLVDAPATHGGRPGVGIEALLPFVGTIDSADLRAIELAVEDGCERVDADEW